MGSNPAWRIERPSPDWLRRGFAFPTEKQSRKQSRTSSAGQGNMVWKPVPDAPSDWGPRPKKTRFLVDESLGVGVANVLRQEGWNAVFADEVGLHGHSDEDIFAFASREDRVLLTHDRHFLDDRRFPVHKNPGVAVLPGAEGNDEALLRALGQIVYIMGWLRDFWRDTKVVVHEDGVWTVALRDFETGAITRTRYRFPKHGPPQVWHDD